MRIVHISDTHGAKNQRRLRVPGCDVLIHSGDIGGRTTVLELQEFLEWFNKQDAKVKIWTAGNHDLCMDKNWASNKTDSINEAIRKRIYADARAMLKLYPDVRYLENEEFEHEGVTFWGSPISPSFHRQNWAFNADRGEEIRQYWNLIPEYVDVLITHGPAHGILDKIPESFKTTPDEDVHRGCEELKKAIEERLLQLKLHCFGHIHDGPNGVITQEINGRQIKFSNGAVLNNSYQVVVPKPLIINL